MFFLVIFSEIIQFNLKMFYVIAVFSLIWQYAPKVYYFIDKKDWLVGLVFEIYLDCKFPFRENIEKNVFQY